MVIELPEKFWLEAQLNQTDYITNFGWVIEYVCGRLFPKISPTTNGIILLENYSWQLSKKEKNIQAIGEREISYGKIMLSVDEAQCLFNTRVSPFIKLGCLELLQNTSYLSSVWGIFFPLFLQRLRHIIVGQPSKGVLVAKVRQLVKGWSRAFTQGFLHR